MKELPKGIEDQIHKTIKDLSVKEFYKGIACGKITIANMVKAKLEAIDIDSSTDDILATIYDAIKFCDLISKVTTPEMEMQIRDITIDKSNK